MSACPDLDAERARLQAAGLHRADLDADPFVQFDRWFAVARSLDLHEPEAMVLSTVGSDSMPSSRHVLLKGIDHGFVFFTNLESQKGRELAVNPRAALCFPWNLLSRQVRIVGDVEPVSAAESDEYFATRPRDSQTGAWASKQSEVLADRRMLIDRWNAAAEEYTGRDVPRPPHWGGLRVVPREIEFWQGQPSRLHDRFRYSRDTAQPSGWRCERLSP